MSVGEKEILEEGEGKTAEQIRENVQYPMVRYQPCKFDYASFCFLLFLALYALCFCFTLPKFFWDASVPAAGRDFYLIMILVVIMTAGGAILSNAMFFKTKLFGQSYKASVQGYDDYYDPEWKSKERCLKLLAYLPDGYRFIYYPLKEGTVLNFSKDEITVRLLQNYCILEKEEKGVEIVPMSEDDLLSARTDLLYQEFAYREPKLNRSEICGAGFFALVGAGAFTGLVKASVTGVDGGSLTLAVFVVFSAFGMFVGCRLAVMLYQWHVWKTKSIQVLARVCFCSQNEPKEGEAPQRKLKLLVDTTDGLRCIFYPIKDPAWTIPITGMVSLRVYKDFVCMEEDGQSEKI